MNDKSELTKIGKDLSPIRRKTSIAVITRKLKSGANNSYVGAKIWIKAWLYVLTLKFISKYEYYKITKLDNNQLNTSLKHSFLTLVGKYRYFVLLVLVPTLFYIFYITIITSDQYQSSSQIVVKQNGGESLPIINLGFLGSAGGGADPQDAYLLQTYIQSRAMLDYLDQQLNLKKYFQSHKIDFFSRLSANADQQKFLDYYNNMISVHYDVQSSSIDIDALAFEPVFSKQLLTVILEKSREFVNRISHTLAQQQLEFALKQFDLAKVKFHNAENKVIAFQNQYKLFNPEAEASTMSSVMSSLQGDLIKAQTQLISLRSYLQPNASQVVAMQQQITAIKQQIINQTKDIIGRNDKDPKLNNVLAQFAWVKLEADFAQTEFTAAQQVVEVSRVNVSKEANAMILIDSPNLPDDYTYPRKIYSIFTVFICLFIFYLIGKMIIIIIQEHRD